MNSNKFTDLNVKSKNLELKKKKPKYIKCSVQVFRFLKITLKSEVF